MTDTPTVKSSFAFRQLLRQRALDKLEKHRSHPDELKIEQSLDRLSTGVEASRSDVLDRNENFLEWIKEKQIKLKQADDETFEKNLKTGNKLVRQYRDGANLFQGTGTEHDILRLEHEDSKAEADWLCKAHSALASNTLIQNTIDDTCREERAKDEGHFESVHRLPYIKKENFRQLVLQSHGKARTAKEFAEKAAAEAFAMFEKLRRQSKLMSFDARARTRRKYLALQDDAKIKAEDAKIQEQEAQRLKEHVMKHGLRPDLYTSVVEEQKILEILAKDASQCNELSSCEKLKLPKVNISSQTQFNRKSNNKEEEKEENKDTEEENLTEWQRTVREGLFLAHVERMDRSKYKRTISDKVEDDQRRYNERELAKISKDLRTHMKNADSPNASLSREDGDVSTWEPEVDFSVLSLSVPNLTVQEDETKVSKHQAYIARGMTQQTAPLICKAWALNCCIKSREACEKRHFYISEREQQEWVANRQDRSSKEERAVVDSITLRESLLEELKEEIASSQKRFDSHFSEKVKLGDIAPLLHLMNQTRLATVRSVEAICAWRQLESRKSVSNISQNNNKQKIFFNDRNSGWVVKISFMGKQLYPGSNAYKSKVKRFCRSEDKAGKRETNFEYVGVYDTQVEALQVYEKRIQIRAMKNNTTIDRLPRPRTIVRSCGKHFAVESDVGLPNTRCEICHAASYDGLITYTPAYLWNGQNYLLKMLRDLDFLQHSVPLAMFFSQAEVIFPLKQNPFFLTESLARLQDDESVRIKISFPGQKSAADLDQNAKDVAIDFGNPTNACLIYDNGCVEWFGHMSKSAKIKVDKKLAYVSRLVVDKALVREFAKIYKDKDIDILDMKRVRTAQKCLMEEERLGKYIYNRRQELKKEKLLENIKFEKALRRKNRQQRRDAGEVVNSDSDSSNNEEQENKEIDPAAISTKYGLRYLREVEIRENKDDYSWIFRTLPDAEEEKMKKAPAGERLKKNKMHTVYYWDRGEYIALQQTRHERTGIEEGVWCSSSPGNRWEGMSVKGRNMKHFNFEENVKRKGKELQRKRNMLQMYLKLEMRRKDKCIPSIIRFLINVGKDIGGSLVLLDCNAAENFLERWKKRTESSITMQRIIRGRLARVLCKKKRQEIALKVFEIRERERACIRQSTMLLQSAISRGIKKARLRLKRPESTVRKVLDGEPVTITLHTLNTIERLNRSKLKVNETCFACQRLHSRKRIRRDLSWFSVRGHPCQGNVKNSELGIVKMRRMYEIINSGPCYCQIQHSNKDCLFVTAFSNITCTKYSTVISVDKLRRRFTDEKNDKWKTCMKEVEYYFSKELLGILKEPIFIFSQDIDIYPNATHIFFDSTSTKGLLVDNLLSNSRKIGSQLSYLTSHDRGLQHIQTSTKALLEAYSQEKKLRFKLSNEAQNHFLRSNFTYLAATTHNHSMTKASDNALLFSTHQLKLYGNLKLSSNLQSWDPVEEANRAIYIRRKWQARKAVKLAEALRSNALMQAFEAEQLLHYYEQKEIDARNVYQNYSNVGNMISIVLGKLRGAYSAISKAKELFIDVILGSLNLRLKNGVPRVSRSIIYGLKHETHNVLYRHILQIKTMKFLKLPILSRRYMVSVLERAAESVSFPKATALPPHWKNSVFTWTGNETHIRAFDPRATVIYNGFLHNMSNYKVSLDQALGMLVQVSRGDGVRELNHSAQQRWKQEFDIKDAVSQPPYLGTIKIECLDLKNSSVVSWYINPIELRELLIDHHQGRPGRPVSNVFSYNYVKSMLISVPNTYQSWHAVIRRLRLQVVSRLLELVHIGTFDGLLKLGKLEFFRLRRSLFQNLFRTQWWKDMRNGRTSLKGTEIYRGGRRIGCGYCVVVVFENYGDLTFEMCWPFRGPRLGAISQHSTTKNENNNTPFYSTDHKSAARILVSETSIRESLAETPNLLTFWIKSVQCCRYSSKLICSILNKICVADPRFKSVKETLLNRNRKTYRRTSKKRSKVIKGGAYSNICNPELYGLVRFPPKPGFSDIDDPSKSATVVSENNTVLALAQKSSNLYDIAHRDLLIVSGFSVLATAFCNPRGDVLITLSRRPMIYDDTHLRIYLTKGQIRMLISSLCWPKCLLSSANKKELFSKIFSVLAIRRINASQPTIRNHASFSKYCKMLFYGVPRGAVAQAIFLECKEKNANTIIGVVLEKDHDSIPPHEFYLPDRKIETVVLSQMKSEEHFHLLSRDVVMTKANGVEFYLEVLKRFNNLWVRVRRPTEYETQSRRTQLEIDFMRKEESSSISLNANSLGSTTNSSYEASFQELYKLANALCNGLYLNGQNEIESVSTLEYFISESRMVFDPFSVEVLQAQRVFEDENGKTITLKIKVMAQTSLSGKILLRVLNMEKNMQKFYILDLHDPLRLKLKQYQDIINRFPECLKADGTKNRTFESQLDKMNLFPCFCRENGTIRHSILRRAIRVNGNHILIQVLGSTEESEIIQFNGVKPRLTYCRTTKPCWKCYGSEKYRQDLSGKMKETRNDIDVTNAIIKHSENTPEKHLTKTTTNYRIKKRTMAPWREARMMWMKYNRQCSKTLNSNQVFSELFDNSPVGEGPEHGGSAKYASPEENEIVGKFTTRSILIDAVCVDILSACSMDISNKKMLQKWLCSAITFELGEDEYGKDDRVYFNWDFFPQRELKKINKCNVLNLPKFSISAELSASDEISGKRLLISMTPPDDHESVNIRTHSFSLVAENSWKFWSLLKQQPFKSGFDPLRINSDNLDPRMLSRLLYEAIEKTLVVRRKGGDLVLAGIDEWWVREQDEHLRIRSAMIDMKKKSRTKLQAQMNVQRDECITARLSAYYDRMFHYRLKLHRESLRAAHREWASMFNEDAYAHNLRNFLAASPAKLSNIRDAFNLYDKNNSGTISTSEFQATVFEVGEILTEKQVAAAIDELDLDKSGEIDFTEFAIWWLCPRKQYIKASTFDTKALKAKLKLYRRFRKTQRTVSELSKSVETKVKGKFTKGNNFETL